MKKAEPFYDGYGNCFDTFLIPISALSPGEELAGKTTPESIDEYPLIIYADGEIQDGHHRYLWMVENGITEARVILAHDIDSDDEIEESEWLEGLFDIYWDF